MISCSCPKCVERRTSSLALNPLPFDGQGVSHGMCIACEEKQRIEFGLPIATTPERTARQVQGALDKGMTIYCSWCKKLIYDPTDPDGTPPQYRRHRRNPQEITPEDKQVLFTIWWLRRDLNHAYYDDIKQLTQKIMTPFELGKSLRRLQDCGYIDSSGGEYTFYSPGQDIAWEMVEQAKNYGKLPPRLRYSD